MNGIHKKSAIGLTSHMILGAHDLGESFLWGRYEEQLPLCAFTDNGLNCRKCFLGPCRMNPFGDEPNHGVCGADRAQVVMENLFQATLNGVLETARSMALLDESLSQQDLPDFSSDLPQETQKRLAGHGILPVQKRHLFEVQNSYFSHQGFLLKTLRDLTRMGLIQFGLMKEMEIRLASFQKDGPSADANGIHILIVGQAPLRGLLAMRDRVMEGYQGKKVNLWLQGGKSLPSFLTIADHGSPELALAMNIDGVIMAADASFPALRDLAQRWEIPVILWDDAKSTEPFPQQALDLALQHFQKKSSFPLHRFQTVVPKAQNRIFEKGKEIQDALTASQIRGILVIWGEANVKHTFFERTLTLMENGIRQSLFVIVGGDIAAQENLLNEELKRRMGGEGGAWGGESGMSFPTYLGSSAEIPKLVALFRNLNSGKEFSHFPAVIAFPEFFRASTWATAVSFLSLGFTVQIGTRLPFWGSPLLTEALLKDWPQLSGGALLASPSVPDSRTQAEQIISLIQARSSAK